MIAPTNTNRIALITGWALVLSIVIGIFASVFIAHGIDINLSADVAATAENMQSVELRVRAKAYFAIFTFILNIVIILGLWKLTQKEAWMIAASSLLISFTGSIFVLLGGVFTLNAAEIMSNSVYETLGAGRSPLTYLQLTSDYTAFHLGLIISTIANAGFFYLFLKSHFIPKVVAAWGLFASIFVVTSIIGRDFIPALGHNAITMGFMFCNLLAILSLGLCLIVRGLRPLDLEIT